VSGYATVLGKTELRADMQTMSQLIRSRGNEKKRPTREGPNMQASPQKKRGCARAVYTTTPKKPNSALRKVAKVRLTNGSRSSARSRARAHIT